MARRRADLWRAAILCLLVTACPAAPPAGERTASSAADAPARLAELFEAFFEESLELDPLLATTIGDRRYNDRLPNYFGPEYRAREEAFHRRWLEAVRDIDRERLPPADRLSYDVFVYQRETALEGFRFPGYLQPINQFFSLPSLFAQIGSGQGYHPFETEEDYRDFLARIDGWVVLADQVIANMRSGVEKGVVQPAILMEKVLPQLEAHFVDDPADSVFYRPLAELPPDLSEETAAELRRAYAAAITEKILPSYRRLHDFIRDEYQPRCRQTVALTALPDGEAWYAYQVRTQTTTDLTPEEIHRIGEAEVARIAGEMRQVMAEVGFEGDLEEFFAFVETDDRFYYDSAEELVAGYREIQQRINGLLPKLFDLFPAHDYEVRPVPAFMAESSAGAFYQEPAADGSRPGVFYVNTFNLRAQPKFVMESLSIHEASPGHHFQVSIAQEIEGLPRFRRFSVFNAYHEGWALYAESLGKELGVFTDPYQYYGRLVEENLRAMRLVVDTGLHSKGWSREQAIDYMLAHSSMAESDAVAEVERYIAWPGQALGYKIGQRAVAELRQRAEQRLGERFDVRAFHRQLLDGGAVPLSVLERKIEEWLARETA